MILTYLKKINLSIILFFPLLTSCQNIQISNDQNTIEGKNDLFYSINIKNLLFSLKEADKKLTPIFRIDPDGMAYYSYPKLPGEDKLTLDEIKKRSQLGSNFYIKDRKKIEKILNKVNSLKINNKITTLNKGQGRWVPSNKEILIDRKVISYGSPYFLDVLSHEVIHASQSCFNGSLTSAPKRIGLPLNYTKDINLTLSHNYSELTEEIINLEREAFTYSNTEGTALKLLNNFCE